MSRRGWILFITMALIWGIPYLLIKVAVDELSPAALVFARTTLAALLLAPLAMLRGQLRPVLARWKWVLAFSVIEICLPWFFLGYAELELSSSLTALLVAAVPLVAALLVRVSGHEQLSAHRIVGLVIGFAGVAALAGFDTGPASPLAVAAVGGVAICYALGPLILARYLADLPGLGVIATALVIAAFLYGPAGVAQWPESAPGARTWLSVGTLAVVCTAIAFVVFFRLVAEVGPARSAVITYVNPAVALLLGVVVLDETITAVTAFGFALILAGSVLATAKDRRRRPSRGDVVTCEDIATPIAEV